MIKTHMAGLACPRVLRLGLFERMPRMTGIALRMSVTIVRPFGVGLSAYLVAAGTTLIPFACHCHGLVAHHGHRRRSDPCEVVFARLELIHLFFMAAGTGFRRWHLRELRVIHLLVVRAVA